MKPTAIIKPIRVSGAVQGHPRLGNQELITSSLIVQVFADTSGQVFIETENTLYRVVNQIKGGIHHANHGKV